MKKLPYPGDEKNHKEILEKENFYISLVVLGNSKDRFKRIIKPTQISHTDGNVLSISGENKTIIYATNIFWYETYDDCVTHFNKQIDEQSKELKERVEKMRKKYEQMQKMKELWDNKEDEAWNNV